MTVEISSAGKIAYILKKGNGTTIPDVWYPIAGGVDPSANIPWSGIHSFSNTVNFNTVVNAKAGINNFANATERTSVLGAAPQNGTTAYLRDTNEFYYFYNGSWRVYSDNAYLSSKTTSFTLAMTDAGKTLDVDSSSPIVITVPRTSTVAFPIGTQIGIIQTGSGQVSFTTEDGTVTILSKNSNKKISARYTPATLIKRTDATWILIGDLTA